MPGDDLFVGLAPHGLHQRHQHNAAVVVLLRFSTWAARQRRGTQPVRHRQRPLRQGWGLDHRQQLLRAQPQFARLPASQGRQIHLWNGFVQKSLQPKCNTLHRDYTWMRKFWFAPASYAIS